MWGVARLTPRDPAGERVLRAETSGSRAHLAGRLASTSRNRPPIAVAAETLGSCFPSRSYWSSCAAAESPSDPAAAYYRIAISSLRGLRVAVAGLVELREIVLGARVPRGRLRAATYPFERDA